MTALVIIIIVVFVIFVNQIRVIRKTGWLPFYIGWYVLGGLVILVLSQLPGLQLRLHHYILAMILIPLTALPTRLSAIYQGFCLGLFLNGVAAFGFASILQTAADVSNLCYVCISFPSPMRLTATSRCTHGVYLTFVLNKLVHVQLFYTLKQSDYYLGHSTKSEKG